MAQVTSRAVALGTLHERDHRKGTVPGTRQKSGPKSGHLLGGGHRALRWEEKQESKEDRGERDRAPAAIATCHPDRSRAPHRWLFQQASGVCARATRISQLKALRTEEERIYSFKE